MLLASMHADCKACAVQGRLDVEGQCRGFLELSKEAVSHLVSSIFADEAFIGLFHKLFCSKEWEGGATTESILATVGDYLEDFEHLIEAFWSKRCAHKCISVLQKVQSDLGIFVSIPQKLERAAPVTTLTWQVCEIHLRIVSISSRLSDSRGVSGLATTFRTLSSCSHAAVMLRAVTHVNESTRFQQWYRVTLWRGFQCSCISMHTRTLPAPALCYEACRQPLGKDVQSGVRTWAGHATYVSVARLRDCPKP